MSLLNQLAEAVQKWVKLGIVDITKPAKLRVDADDTDMSGVLVQGTNNSYHMIAMVGCEPQITEAKCSMIKRLALAAAWCVKKLNHYTSPLAAGPGFTIIYPHAAEVTCMNLHDLPVCLQARLVKLFAHSCKFVCGYGAWAVSGAVCCIAHDKPAFDPTPALRTWQHEHYVVKKQ